jgi:hypothetical protein
MSFFAADIISAIVIAALIVLFIFLIYLPRICQKSSENKNSKKSYKVVTNSKPKNSRCENSWLTESTFTESVDNLSDDGDNELTYQDAETINELEYEYDYETVAETIRVSVHCPGGKLFRKSRRQGSIQPNSKVIRNLNLQLSTQMTHKISFAV